MNEQELRDNNEHLTALLRGAENERDIYRGYAAENKRNWIAERHKRIAYQGVLLGLAITGLVIILLNILHHTGAL